MFLNAWTCRSPSRKLSSRRCAPGWVRRHRTRFLCSERPCRWTLSELLKNEGETMLVSALEMSAVWPVRLRANRFGRETAISPFGSGYLGERTEQALRIDSADCMPAMGLVRTVDKRVREQVHDLRWLSARVLSCVVAGLTSRQRSANGDQGCARGARRCLCQLRGCAISSDECPSSTQLEDCWLPRNIEGPFTDCVAKNFEGTAEH